MHLRKYYLINAITLYRLLSAFLLGFLIIKNHPEIFKWFLALSFFTDAIDGFLARKYQVSSIAGAKLDSIADDLTILAAIAGMIVFKPEFIKEEIRLFIIVLILYIFQTVLALARYGKITSFHTYAAKISAVLQAVFLLFFYFLPDPIPVLFYFAMFVTAVDLIEEIILVTILSEWQANVKGLYWVLKHNLR